MTRRLVSSTIMVLLLCGTVGFAQEKISPLSDYMYKRDFPRYEEIKKETDPQKLAGMLVELMKDRPINRVLPYIIQDYRTIVVGYLDKKEWDRALSLIEEFKAVLPTDKAVEDEEIPVGVEEFMQNLRHARTVMDPLVLSAYYSSGNWTKAAELQEQLYAAAPSIQGVQLLADIYMRMENFDKYLENAAKIISEFTISKPEGFDAAYKTLQIYRQKNDMPSIIDISRKIMDVYGDRLPEGIAEAQWNPERVSAFMLFAQEPYQAKDFPKAMELFERVLKSDPKNGDAWYYIGMCKWNIEGQDGAVEPFAKSVVLNGATAATARQRLEQIHKAKNKDSLDGLDEILAQAKTDLGI